MKKFRVFMIVTLIALAFSQVAQARRSCKASLYDNRNQLVESFKGYWSFEYQNPCVEANALCIQALENEEDELAYCQIEGTAFETKVCFAALYSKDAGVVDVVGAKVKDLRNKDVMELACQSAMAKCAERADVEREEVCMIVQ